MHSLYELDSNFEITAIIVSRTNCSSIFQTNATHLFRDYSTGEKPTEASEGGALLYIKLGLSYQPIWVFMYFVGLNQGWSKLSAKNCLIWLLDAFTSTLL